MMWRLLWLSIFWVPLVGAADSFYVGMLDDRAPYSDFGVLERADGVLPELLELLSVPGEIEFVPKSASDLPQLTKMLQQGDVLLALPPPLSPAPPGVLVSQPILQQHWAVITRNNHFPVHASHDINLNQQRILLLRNSSVGPRLTALWPDVVLEKGVMLHEALKLLNAGAADGIVCDAALADMLVHNLFPGLLSRAVLPGISSNQALWVLPGQHEVLERLNQRIAELPTGAASAIITRWLLNAALDDLQPIKESNKHLFDSLFIVSTILSLFLIAFLLSEILRRRRAERGLRDALVYWQTLLNSVPAPLLVCNPAGKITHCNETLLASLHLAHEQVVGRMLEEFMALNPMSPPLEHQEWVNTISTLSPHFSDRSLIIQGESREIMQWLTAYSDSRKVPQGLLIGWYDISERKRLERQLAITSRQAVAASQEKSDFLARMSHEIRSPMNAILGVLELEQQKQGEKGSALNIAYTASRQLLQIVGGVLDLSKIEAGEIKLQLQKRALYPLLTQVVNTFSTLAEQKGLQLKSDLEATKMLYYRIDGIRLSQVLNNLLSNAIKYTELGVVCLSVSIQGQEEGKDRLTFNVEDSGVGIAQEMQDIIQQPYVQLDPHSPASTGLGLAICVQLLRLMGSELHIESTPGKGSCFTFSLLLERVSEETLLMDYPDSVLAGKPQHILVVDDQPANLLVMKLQLETLGHQVTTCDDVKQAEQRLSHQTFDLVLTDCQMPVMTGYQLASRQREREREAGGYQVIVGCTANAFNDEQERCLASGMDAVLIKPLTLQDLRQLLTEQQQIALDMTEIQAMAAKQTSIIDTIIEELQRSSQHDLQLLLQSTTEDPEPYCAVLHRQKGSFALAGFQAGVSQCQLMEKALREENSTGFPIYRLQLNALILRFISQLERQKGGQQENRQRRPDNVGTKGESL
ncbi:ATP-binding protein [Enterobacter chuandaensis]